MLSGAHLREQVREGLKADGYGGSTSFAADIATQKSALRAQMVRQRSTALFTDDDSRKLIEHLTTYLETRSDSVIAGLGLTGRN